MAAPPWTPVVEAWLVAGRRHPARIAVTDDTATWSYAELEWRALRWATRIEAATQPGDRVVLALPLCANAIAAALGVLAAGRTLVALDPQQVHASFVAQASHADPTAIIGTLSGPGMRLLPESGDPLPHVSWPGVALQPSGPAALQYTSGTTGVPKAILWSHATVTRAARHLRYMFEFTPLDRHALMSPLSVASSLAQVTAVLAAGAELHVCEARTMNLAALNERLRVRKITTIQTVPSLFRALCRDAGGLGPSLRAIKLGGEPVTALDARLFIAGAPEEAMLINGLGLSEAGYNVCWRAFRKHELPHDGPVPIGFAAPDIELSADPQDGELMVRAPDLADGYWRDDAATASRFAPVTDRPGWRTLQTGDLVQKGPDGSWVHLGRSDDRIKIRGHGVDPAAVTAVLLGLEGVCDAAVLAQQEQDVWRLHAFVVLDAAVHVRADDVRAQLAALVPDYSLPVSLDLVATLPRLPGGKLDRQRLLAATSQKASSREAVAPRNALEHTLHALFARQLPRRSSFGVDESFFALGGDSLGAAEVMAAVGQVLGVEVPLAELALHPSVEALARRIEAGGWNTNDHPLTLLTPAPRADAVPLFMWPGAGSDVLALAELARHLGPDISVYALQHRGADGRRSYDLSVEAMAERALPFLRRVQPKGPYALCGTSFGGLVAIEVARRLLGAGEAIRFLGLLDTYAPGYPRVRRDLSMADKVQLLLRVWRPLGRRDEPGLRNLLRGVAEHWTRLQARRWIKSPDAVADPLPLHRRYHFLQEACFQASASYKPAPLEATVHLFRAEPLPATLYENDPSLGWDRWMPGTLRVVDTPGRHGAHIREPHVRELAERLRGALFGA